jgi:hypothetical protein
MFSGRAWRHLRKGAGTGVTRRRSPVLPSTRPNLVNQVSASAVFVSALHLLTHIADTSTLPSSTDASTTRPIAGGETTSPSRTPAASASTSSPTATESTPPSPGGSSTNVGAIAGGVVGGVVGLALIGAGVFYLLYRKKKKDAAAASALPTGYAPPPNQPGYPVSPNMGFATAYQANEAKPVGVQEGAFYNQGPAPYPQGPYDPHMSYAGSPPPQEVPAAQPQFGTSQQAMPQEMPTSK